MNMFTEKLNAVVGEVIEAYDGDIAPLIYAASNFHPNSKNLSWQFQLAIADLPSSDLYGLHELLEEYGCFKVISFTQEYFADNKEYFLGFMTEKEYEAKNIVLLNLIKNMTESVVMFRPMVETN